MSSAATTNGKVKVTARKGPLRWTLEKAASEFGVDRKTITKKLRNNDAEPGTDSCYSTQQIVSSLFDDSGSERTRLYREQADKLALANAKSRSEQLDVETVYKAYEGCFVALRQSILASSLSDLEKSELLTQLRHDVTDAKPIE